MLNLRALIQILFQVQQEQSKFLSLTLKVKKILFLGLLDQLSLDKIAIPGLLLISILNRLALSFARKMPVQLITQKPRV